MSDQPIDAMKARIRNDIRAAMVAKNTTETKVLRTLLAALDNAEAVPVDTGHMPYVERAFGDPQSEVVRLTLSLDDIEAVLTAERQERLAAASDLDRHNRSTDAVALRSEAAIVARYLRTAAD